MATKIGPKTVTQRDRSKSLVFCVDAAHPDSYGGEPTTNSVGSNASAYTAGNETATYADAPEKGPDWKKITITARGSAFRVSRWDYITADAAGNKVTMSVEYEFAAGNSAGYYWTLDGTGGHTVSSAYTENNKKQSYTAYSGTGASKVIAIFLYNYSTGVTGLNDVIYYRYYQAEQKDHSTPYTATSRTATTAINNISGVGARGTNWIQGSAADTYGQELAYHSDGYSLGTQDGRSVAKTRKVLRTRESNKGHIGGAYWDLDGTDEYIVTANENFTNSGQAVSVSQWVNMSSSLDSNDRKLFHWGGGGNAVMQMRKGDNNGRIKYQIHSGGSWRTVNIDSYFEAADTWYHFAVVQTSSTVMPRIYRNGEEMSHGTSTWYVLDYSLVNSISIGSRQGNEQWKGPIANFMMWSSALTSKEIKDIYIAQKGRFGK